MARVVLIQADISLNDFYKGIKAGLDRRFMPGPHNYYPELTDKEAGELATYSRYAENAGNPPPGVHPERIVR